MPLSPIRRSDARLGVCLVLGLWLLCLWRTAWPWGALWISGGVEDETPAFAIFDTFTRTEDPLASGWLGPIINAADCEADGDEIVRDLDGPTNCGSYWNTASCADTCQAELTIGAGAGGTVYLCFLTDIGGGGDGYCVRVSSTTTNVRKFTDGGGNTIIGTSATVTWANGERLGLRKTGTTLAVYQNDTQIDSETDATFTGPWQIAVLIESTFRGSEIGATLP